MILLYATVSNNTPSFAFVDESRGVVCHSLAELGNSEADEDEEYVLSMYILIQYLSATLVGSQCSAEILLRFRFFMPNKY